MILLSSSIIVLFLLSIPLGLILETYDNVYGITYQYNENVVVCNGEETDDEIEGTVNNDIIFGWIGNDFLRGMAGDDVILGGEGADTIIGDISNDVEFII
jgi:Ca2+-binding RTX toxin-like protein